MGITHRFDNNMLLLEFPSLYTTEEMRTAVSAAIADPTFAEGMNMLVDARASQVFPSLQEMSARMSLLISLSRYIGKNCAIVVSNQKHYHNSLILSDGIRKEGLYLRVFDDFDVAKTWLISLANTP